MQIKVYLTDKDLAERYRVHRTTVWRWVRRGNFPSPDRLSENCSRWSGEKVEAWEQSRD